MKYIQYSGVILEDNQKLENNFKEFIKEEIQKTQSEYCYPNQGDAFSHVALKLLFNFNDEEAAEQTLVAGPGDKKLDAFWYNQTSSELYIIQSKYQKPSSRMKKFDETAINECHSAFETLLHSDRCGLKDEILECADLLKTAINRNSHIYLLTVVFGDFTPTAKKRIKTLNNKFLNQNFSYLNISVEGITFQDLFTRYQNNLDYPPEFPSDTFEVLNAFVLENEGQKSACGIIQVLVAQKWYKKFGNKLFQKNVRNNLTYRNPINKKIETTLKNIDERKRFLYYNNGLTITCDNLSYDQNKGTMFLEKFQVVNGCQTVCSISRVLDQLDENIDAFVFIKITETTNDEFQNLIAEHTNTQSAILPRDLCSNDFIQNQLYKQFFEINYFYNKKKGEFQSLYTIKKAKQTFGQDYKTKIISNDEASTALISFYGYPHIGYTLANKLVDKSGDYYHIIFPPSRDLYELLMPWLLLKKIDGKRSEYRKLMHSINPLPSKRTTEEKRIYESNKFIKHGNNHILACFGYIIAKRYDVVDISNISGRENLKKLTELIRDNSFFETYYNQIIADLRVFFTYKKESKDSTIEIRNFFKKEASYQDIKEFLDVHNESLKSRDVNLFLHYQNWPSLNIEIDNSIFPEGTMIKED